MSLNKLRALGLICSLALMLGGNGSALANPYVSWGGRSAQGDGIPRTTPAEVLALLRRKKAILIDVRSLEAYKDRHIKGALSIPVEQIEARLKELPRGKTIATYCSWPAEHTSARAAQIINEKGIANAAAVVGGYDALVKAGFATAKSGRR